MTDNQNPPQNTLELTDAHQFSFNAYQVFCALKYICVNDPFNELFLTANDLAAKTGVPVNTVKAVVESLVEVGWAQYDNAEKTDISCTKAGHEINNISMFSARFPMPHGK